MRMRNKPWALDFLKEQEVVVFEPSIYQGQWRDILNRDFLRLEIGSGKGDYWIKMSEMYANEGWIGVEKDVSVSAVAIKKVVGKQHSNRKFICSDATNIEQWFEVGELDIIHLNFSDPWPKKRYSKRRLTDLRFLTIYDKILSEDGCIIMKTDNKSLFEFSLIQFSVGNWLLEDVNVDYRSTAYEEDVMTEYETKFVALGQPIYRAVWRKRKENS